MGERREGPKERQDWTNALLRGKPPRIRYRVQPEEEVESDKMLIYLYSYTFHLQFAVLQTAQVNDSIPTSSLVLLTSGTEYQQMREGTKAQYTLSVFVCRKLDFQSFW